MTVLLSGIHAGPRLPGSRRFVTSPTHPYSIAPSGVRRRLSPAGEITSLQAAGCEPYRQDTAPGSTPRRLLSAPPVGRDEPRISAVFGAGISFFLCTGSGIVVRGPRLAQALTRAKAGRARRDGSVSSQTRCNTRFRGDDGVRGGWRPGQVSGRIDLGRGPAGGLEAMNRPAFSAYRSFGLSARLSIDLRARCRGDRRADDRAGARREGERLHGGRDLRQGRALRRAHPQPGPAASSASAA